jgi:hypothetical protein
VDTRPAYAVVRQEPSGFWSVVACRGCFADAEEEFRRQCLLQPGWAIKLVTVHASRP